ncbi:ATP-binding cassette sub-family A member 9-like [Sycon ciliatum]|uniref:ATP-binding cassette sub-family A member 9-like n=1 Tax=Sycon ciliatum TaxID=27933 RepID=UPI0031F626CA
MVSITTQFIALLKRNFLLKRRKWKVTLFEFTVPVYFTAILAAVKLGVNPDLKPEVTDPPCFDQNVWLTNISDKVVLYAPNASFNGTGIVNHANRIMVLIGGATGATVKGFANESDLVSYYRGSGSVPVLGAIVFDDGMITSGKIPTAYDIRFDSQASDVPKTSKTYLDNNGFCRSANLAQNVHNNFKCPTAALISSGFMQLQARVDAAILQLTAANLSMPDYTTNSTPCFMPKADYLPAADELQTLTAIYMVIAYSPMVSILLSLLVTEKEKKIKIGMKMMGMSDVALWLAWAVTYAFVLLISTAIITIIALASKLFDPSNMGLVFLMLYMYGLSIMAFAFALVPFFSKASVAAAIGSLSTILFSLFYLLLSRVQTSLGVKWFLSIFSPTALGLGLAEVINLNSVAGGLQTSNIGTAGDLFPVRGVYIMLFVDIVLYFLLALYFDRVIPDEFGRSWSPIFFLQPSFLRSLCYRRKGFKALVSDGSQAVSYGTVRAAVSVDACPDSCPPLPRDPNVEEVPSSLKHREAIKIRSLRKVYTKSFFDKWIMRKTDPDVVACDDVNLSVYEGEITALLGHNGAGKSTLISMLTGMVTPSTGLARIYGLDIDSPADMAEVRQFTGVCPQHDILYEELTVREHLLLFARIKGIPGDCEEQEVLKIMKRITLDDKADCMSSNLSGGQKRKLSVGIALIGDPKIVFLDEPTSGMDPLSRRQLWTLLKSSRKERIIFLTTHFMDEADILADRKAILSKGRVQCAGSSVFLKSRFGIGYNLSMVTMDTCPVGEVRSLIQEKVSGASKGRSHGKELAFRLPLNQSKLFAGLFSYLEEDSAGRPMSEQLGIQSYGISMTTLEEVFLKLGENEEAETPDASKGKKTAAGAAAGADEMDSPVDNSRHSVQRQSSLPFIRDRDQDDDDDAQEDGGEGAALHGALSTESAHHITDPKTLAWQQFKTLFWMRLLLNVRNGKWFFSIVFVPPVMIIIGLVLASRVTTSSNVQSDLALNSSLYFSNDPSCTGVSSGPSRLLYADNTTTGTSNIPDSLSRQGYNVCKVDSNLSSFAIANRSHHGIVQVVESGENVSLAYRVMGNSTATFSLPLVFNLMSSVALQMLDNTASGITTTVKPLPDRTPELELNPGLYTALFVIALGLANMATAFIQMTVEDKEIRARHQLLVSGVTKKIYWLNLFTFNFATYMVLFVLVLIVVAAVQVDSLTTGGAMFAMILSFILYAMSMILFSFLVSFAFSKRSTVESSMSTVLIFMVMIPFFTVSIIDQLSYTTTARALHYGLCAIDAPYCFSGMLYYIDRVYRIHSLGIGGLSVSSYFDFEANISGSLLLVFGQCLVFLFFIYYIETGDRRRAKKVLVGRHDEIEKLDSDVRDEITRALEYDPDPNNDEDCLVLRNLRKEFATSSNMCVPQARRKPPKVAVNGLCLGVRQGEVLGFLGPNGAGKTTTMNMVTGDAIPDGGEVYLEGHPLVGSAGRQQALGYCPQADAVWKDLSLEEHMRVFALLKGVSPDSVDLLVNQFIDTMDIRDHAKKRSKDLSGGTKRKLSFAMSLLGNTRICLLDEPSTGLDPSSKRFLWNVISNSIHGKRAAVLTTHSMDEADALCSRVGIIVNGRLQCIGSTQHLKTKYGGHYQLELKLSTEQEGNLEERMEAVRQYIKDLFSGMEVMEEFNERALYKIPLDELGHLSVAFSALEEAKEKFSVEEYSLSQASLEQVFINFAKKQHDAK